MKTFNLLVGVLLFFAAAITTKAAPLTSSATKDVLYISQSTLPSGQVSITARQGPLTNSQDGFGIKAMGVTLAQNAIPVTLPLITLGTGHATATGLPTKGTATTLANKKIKDHLPIMQSGLSAYLKQYGLSSAWFNFKQEVQLDVGGTAQTWVLYWDYFTDAEGRGTYGDVQVVTTDPRILYLTYNPVAIDDTLPAGWKYPDAGKLSYQLRNMQWQAVTDFVTVDVGGVYDTPHTETDETLDSGIACLMDNTPASCPKGYPTVKDLLDSTGAVIAVVDYRRRVQPVYKDNGDGTESPVMTISIDNRYLQYVGCADVNYRNIGRFGFELDISVGRYLALSYGEPRVVQYNLVQTFEGKQLSPTSNYDFTLKISRNTAKGVAPYVIDPMKGQQLYLASDLPGVQYIAPLSVSGEISYELGSFTSESFFTGSNHEYKAMFVGRCSETGGYEVRTTLLYRYKWGAWTYYPESVSPVNNYSWSPVGLYGHGDARYTAYADEAAGILRVHEFTQSGCYFICNSQYANEHNYSSMMKDGPAVSGGLYLGSVFMQQFYDYGSYSNSIWWRCGTSANVWYMRTYNQWGYATDIPSTHKYCSGTYYFRGFDMNARTPYFVLEKYPTYPYNAEIDPSYSGAAWYEGGKAWQSNCQVDYGWWTATCYATEYNPSIVYY